MGFKSGKQQSGRTMPGGDTSRSSSQRVSMAGRRAVGGKRRLKLSGSATGEIPKLSFNSLVDVLLTTVTVRIGSSRPGDGVIWWIADTNPLEPSQVQIKAGLEQAGGAADDDGTGAATASFDADLTGLTGSTTYYFWAYQEGAEADGPTLRVVVDTAAVTLITPASNTLTDTTANITATADAALGTAYGIVDELATAPSAAQIKAGLNGAGAAADFAGDVPGALSIVIPATGLTAVTDYNLFIVVEGPNGVFSNIVTNIFTTTA